LIRIDPDEILDAVERPVKTRRYDASRRKAASDRTRQRILDVADAHLRQRGYAETTVATIASSADVHVDTVYALVGKKVEIVHELIELALSGGENAVPAADRPYVTAIRAEPDPANKLALYAAATCDMLARVAPLVAALRDAAGTDDTAAEIWRAFSDRRAHNMRAFVEDVASVNGLRAGLDPDTAADTVWATNSPEIYLMLTTERGWTPDQYEKWLEDTWIHLLLPAPITAQA
jgi:AcrR family transcriptional regulator